MRMKHSTLTFAALVALTMSASAMPAGMRVTCSDDAPANIRETYVFTHNSVTINGVRYPAQKSRSGPGLVAGPRIFAASPDYRRWAEMGANIGRMEWMRCRA